MGNILQKRVGVSDFICTFAELFGIETTNIRKQ